MNLSLPGDKSVASTISTLDPQLRSALESAVEVLRDIGDMELPAGLDLRMRKLGEQREACTDQERDEYAAWVEFTQVLTRDRLRAQRLKKVARNSS